MWLLPALIVGALLIMILACGIRAVWRDLGERRWLWALAGTLATAAGFVAVALVSSFAHLSAPLGL
jgi:hypothetical protein